MIVFDPAAPPAKHALDGRPMPAKLLGAVEPVDEVRATNPPSNGPLLDNVTAVTGVPRGYPAWPQGTQAIEYRPRHRNIAGVNDYALDTFGQSPRANVCACQTRKNPSLSQVMQLLVGDTVGPRVRTAAKNGGVLQAIVARYSTPEGIIDELFIRSLGRRPTSDEMQTMLGVVAEGTQPAVYEDIFSGLLASSEFMFLR